MRQRAIFLPRFAFLSLLVFTLAIVSAGWADQDQYAPGQLIVKYKEAVSAAAFSYSLGASALPPSSVLAGLQSRHPLKNSRRLFRQLADPRKAIYNRADLLAHEHLTGKVRAAAKAGAPGSFPNLHNIYVLTFQDKTLDMEAIAREMRSDPNVEYAYPNYRMKLALTPGDPEYAAHNWPYLAINAEAGWDLNTGNTGVVIAVVDTGMDLTHPDLASNLWTNPGEAGANSANAVDDDNNDYIDDVHGWNFVDHDMIADLFLNSVVAVSGNTYTCAFSDEDVAMPPNQPEDTFGHGTMMAGVAAAAHNSAGSVGLAWDCQIMPLRVGATYDQSRVKPGWIGDPLYIQSDWVASAIVYAADNGAAVVNLSLVDNNWSSGAVKDAIDAAYTKGVVIVGSAGNNSESLPTYPAAYALVLGVAAMDNTGNRAIWGTPQPPLYQGNGSNYGTWISVAAPGTDVYSTTLNNGYTTGSGTSIATAFVSGLAGLVRSLHPAFTNAEVMKVITSTTDPVSAGQYIGTGKINVQHALQMNAVPEAQINTPTSEQTVYANLDIAGSAGGVNFSSYTLQYGQGFYPASWTTFAAGNAPVANSTLGTWDLSSVPDNLAYILRLSVTDTSGNVSRSDVVVYVQKSAQPGWPKTLGDYFVGNTYGDNIAIGDIDHDNQQEIVVTSRRIVGGSNQTSDIYVFHPDGSPASGWAKLAVNKYLSPPTIADLNATGDKQIIISGWDGWMTTTFYVFDNQGNNYPGWPKQYSGTAKITPQAASVGDLDNDGNLEIVLPGQHDAGSGQHALIFVYRSDGTAMPGWPKDMDLNFPVSTSAVYDQASHACLADINGDGHLDIICEIGFYQDTKIYAWDYQGNTLTGWPVHLGDLSVGQLAAGDINNDGHMEIVATADNRLYAFKGDGTALSGAGIHWPVALSNGLKVPVLADLDGDGKLETIVYCYDDKIYAYDADGNLLAGWPKAVNATFIGGERPVPVLADLNNDGHPEVIYAAGEDENIYAWDGNGNAVSGWPKVIPGVETLTPAIGDIQNNGNASMAIAYNSNVLNLWSLNTPYNAATSAWPMAWFNSNHTSAYNMDITAPTVTLTAPLNGATLKDTVQFSANAGDNVHLSGVRFQVDGAFVGNALTAGPFSINWNTLDLPNGTHTVTALAWDLAGNRTISAAVTITTNNIDLQPPDVAMVSPADGTTVSGMVAVSATAQDNGTPSSGINRVQFRLDGANLGAADNTAPYIINWDTASAAAGSHALTAMAWDGAGNSTESSAIAVTVVHAPPTAAQIVASHLSVGEIKVVGSAQSRGAVNPARGEAAQIYYLGNGQGEFTCTVYTLTGERVWRSTKNGPASGMFEWRPADAASGVYMVAIQGPGVKAHKKLVVLR